jgi:hypothetical protein
MGMEIGWEIVCSRRVGCTSRPGVSPEGPSQEGWNANTGRHVVKLVERSLPGSGASMVVGEAGLALSGFDYEVSARASIDAQVAEGGAVKTMKGHQQLHRQVGLVAADVEVAAALVHERLSRPVRVRPAAAIVAVIQREGALLHPRRWLCQPVVPPGATTRSTTMKSDGCLNLTLMLRVLTLTRWLKVPLPSTVGETPWGGWRPRRRGHGTARRWRAEPARPPQGTGVGGAACPSERPGPRRAAPALIS